jgi:hypothetical protein
MIIAVFKVDGRVFDTIPSVIYVGRESITFQTETGYKHVKLEDMVSLTWKPDTPPKPDSVLEGLACS